MYSHEGYHIGDAWYYVDRRGRTETVHMFYLTRPLDGGLQDLIGHAISQDLMRWETLEPALRPGPPRSWDDLKLCTGSVMARDGRYWLAYSATNTADSSTKEPYRVQRAGLAVSDDLFAWQRFPESELTHSGPPHYEGMSSGQRKMAHWRDPFLFVDGNAVYQFVCARRSDGEVATRGTVAVAKSSDMIRWEILPPVQHDRVADEIEVPQVYEMNGRWYLVFCTLGRFLAPTIIERFRGAVPERSNFSLVGGSPFGPFRLHGTGQIVCHPPEEYFYAAQLVCFRGSWYLLATIHDEGAERISDAIPVYGDETGVHG